MEIEAYVDLFRLPEVYLVAFETEYGGIPVGLRFSGDGGGATIDYEPTTGLEYETPIIARLEDAYIRTTWNPGNGMQIATYRVEIADAEQVSFWLLQDGLESPLQVEFLE